MAHNPNVILLGTIPSTVKKITREDADPSTFVAGLAVRRASNGGLQLNDNGTAAFIGISLGESLDGAGATAVCRKGNFVPVVVENDAASRKLGDITFTSKLFGPAGNAVSISTINGGAVNVAVVGNAITVTIVSTTTLASAIKTAIESNADANALISVLIDSGKESTAQTANAGGVLSGGSDFCVPGTAVRISDTSGKASVDGDVTAATYLTGVLTGVYPNGTTAPAALIAMPGGL